MIERHFGAIYRFFACKLDVDVSDLVQRTFLGCLEAADRFRGRSSLRTYLFAIARNELLTFLRQQRRDSLLDFSVTSLHDLQQSPSSWAADHQLRGRLHAAMRALPLDLQIALELYYFEDVRADALAEILEVPLGTVRSRIRRGIEALREIVTAPTRGHRAPDVEVAQLDEWAEQLGRCA